jgi:hypothetical protein
VRGRNASFFESIARLLYGRNFLHAEFDVEKLSGRGTNFCTKKRRRKRRRTRRDEIFSSGSHLDSRKGDTKKKRRRKKRAVIRGAFTIESTKGGKRREGRRRRRNGFFFIHQIRRRRRRFFFFIESGWRRRRGGNCTICDLDGEKRRRKRMNRFTNFFPLGRCKKFFPIQMIEKITQIGTRRRTRWKRSRERTNERRVEGIIFFGGERDRSGGKRGLNKKEKGEVGKRRRRRRRKIFPTTISRRIKRCVDRRERVPIRNVEWWMRNGGGLNG